MRATMILLALGMSYFLSIVLTACVLAVYLAFHGDYDGLVGLAVDGGICLVCVRVYLWSQTRR
jgi:hypothetical protein